MECNTVGAARGAKSLRSPSCAAACVLVCGTRNDLPECQLCAHARMIADVLSVM